MPNPNLYRKAARIRLSSPEKLDEYIRVIKPRGWVAMAALGVLVLAALAWGLFGRIAQTTTAQGAIVVPNSVFSARSAASGVVTDVALSEGAQVRKGQTIATVAVAGSSSGKAADVVSPVDGVLLENDVSQGSAVSPGTVVGRVRAAGTEQARLFAYLTPSAAASLRRGMSVRISPVGFPSDSYGYLQGKVSYIGEFPASQAAVLADVQDPAIAQALITGAQGAPVAVQVGLTRAATPSGYAWSRGDGPARAIPDGTLASLSISTGDRHPISYIVG